MSRFVVLRQASPKAAADGGNSDTWVQRLTKYVPGEFLVLYTGLIGFLVSTFPQATPNTQWMAVSFIAIFSILVAVYFYKRAPAGKVRLLHLILSPLAFVALSYPISAPLLGGWFVGWLSSVVQILFAAITIAWFPEDSDGSGNTGGG